MNTAYKGDCIDHQFIKIGNNDFTITNIPLNNYANRAILQFFVDVDTDSFPTSKIGYTPIVKVCEDGKNPIQNFDGEGMAILNFGTYEVVGRKNLKNIKMILFAGGYDLYCKINYYK